MNMFKMAAMLEANLANLDALTQGFSPMREGRLASPSPFDRLCYFLDRLDYLGLGFFRSDRLAPRELSANGCRVHRNGGSRRCGAKSLATRA